MADRHDGGVLESACRALAPLLPDACDNLTQAGNFSNIEQVHHAGHPKTYSRCRLTV
jgi:hypothetical protein